MTMTAKWKTSSEQSPDKTKSKIISEFKSIVEAKWQEELFDVIKELEEREIWLLNVGTEKPCKLYFNCGPDVALKHLVELMLSGRLGVILQSRVNELMQTGAIAMTLSCKASTYEHCKKYYSSRPVGE